MAALHKRVDGQRRGSRLAFWLTVAGLIVIVTVSAGYLYLITKSPLSFDETDFDNSGYVTLSELFYASSYGVRALKIGARNCVEYYSLKDGLRLKLECDHTNQQ